jgi:replicative DNA helicase
MSLSKPWKDQRAAYKDALKYINGRKQGIITSFRTPWDKVNDAGVNGFEWHSMTVIGGRPGTGKTLIKDQIIRESFSRNKGQNINVLEFSFEMVAKASKVREFCSILGKSYKYVCSAYSDNKLTDEDFNKLYAHAKKAVDIDKYPVSIVENPCEVEQIKNIVSNYMIDNSQIIDGNRVFTNTVITLDHSYLVNKSKSEKSKTDMLYNLGEALTDLKRKFPIAFIVLSQLGRHVESPERNENGKYGNYILETDILGGDALFQHADMCIGINRPAMKFIEYYGPERYIIQDDSVLVFHFLKTRTGDTRMSFFKAMFEKMEVQEMPTPGIQQKRVNTN